MTEQPLNDVELERAEKMIGVLANYIWTKQTRPGDHIWSIPVDQSRDFDVLFSRALTELKSLRARLDAAEQEKADLLRMNAELHEERQYLVSLRTRLDAAERQLEAFREYKAGMEAAVAEHVASAKE